METLLNRYRNLTVLLIVVMTQLVLLAYQVKSNQDVRLIRIWAVTAVTPLAKVLEFVRDNTWGVAVNYFVLVNVRGENARLKEELGKIKMENQFLKTELETAERARALQAFQARTPSRTIPARIIGTGTGANSRVVFVDQGAGSGVMRGMAVVTPDGIVGKVLAAYPTASQVLLITDPTFAAGVISEKNRVHGTLKGLGQSKCIVDYVQNEEKVENGEMFYTSGDDRIFPKGMPVGRVNVVRQGRNFKEIFVVPSGTQSGLEEVLIVLEGVHQPIPEAQQQVSTEVKILPPPADPVSASQPSTTAAGLQGTLQTEADKLRERYKRIGEAQNHVYGEGRVGPNLNINPDAAKPPAGGTASPAPQTSAPKPPPTGASTQGATTPAPQTATPKPPVGAITAPQTATPKPNGTAPQTATPKPPTGATTAPQTATPKPNGTAPQTATPKPPAGATTAPQIAPPKPNGTAPQTATPKPPAGATTAPQTATPKPPAAQEPAAPPQR